MFYIKQQLAAMFVLLLCFSTNASEFGHFKVNFENLRKHYPGDDQTIENQIKGLSVNIQAVKSKETGVPVDHPTLGQSPEIYDRILKELGMSYNLIGIGQVRPLLGFRETFGLGESNNSGFTWQKPMGSFSVYAWRNISPAIIGTDWIVSDTLVISINATTFLHNMKEKGIIDISDKQLALFAGMTYKRQYYYDHVATSYEDGMSKEFNKLFLSFTMFSPEKLLTMDPYDYLTRSDYISVKAGGMVHIPETYGLTFSAGAFGRYAKVATVDIQALGENDVRKDGEVLRVTTKHDKVKEIMAAASLHADFFKILSLTLLSYEYKYTYTETDNMQLSFFEKDRKTLETNNPTSHSLKRLLQFKRSNISKDLDPYLVSRDQRIKENKTSKYMVLLKSGISSNETEQIVYKNELTGNKRFFFKNHYEKTQVKKSFWARIIEAFFKVRSQNSIFSNYEALKSKKLAMEYEVGADQADIKQKHMKINADTELSLVLTQRYSVRMTKGRKLKKYLGHAHHFLSNYTNIEEKIRNGFKSGLLRSPLNINTKIKISSDGVKHFTHLSIDKVHGFIDDLCYKKRKCVRKLKKSYKKYINEVNEFNEVHLFRLRDFLITVHKYSDNLGLLQNFFGEQNTFFNGQLSAMTATGRNYRTHFKANTPYIESVLEVAMKEESR